MRWIDRVPPGVYAITPDGLPAEAIRLGVLRLLEAGIRLLQLRSKHLDTAARAGLARALLPACHAHGVPLIVNDDLDLAERVGADGVHLGRNDGSLARARARLGPGAVVGASCYADFDRALAAADEGASYVAFGAVYPSPSKPAAPPAPVELFRRWTRADVPAVAIGGLDADNAGPVLAAGARWVAMIGALWQAPDPRAVVQRIHERLVPSQGEPQHASLQP